MNRILFIDKLALFTNFGLLVFFVSGQLFSSTSIRVQMFYYYRHALELIVILSIVYLICNSSKLKNLSPVTCVVLLWIFWSAPSSLAWASEASMRVYLQENLLLILFWPMMYLFFYIFLVKYPTSINVILLLFIFLVVLCSCIFLFIYDYRNADPTRSAISGEALASLNQVYYPLTLLPWILLINKPSHRFIFISIIAALVFYSMKRTALIAFTSSIIAYISVLFIMQPRARLAFLVSPLILISLMVGLFYYYDEIHGGYFSYRLGSLIDDQGSGRLDIYSDVIAMICSSSMFDLFMGHGFDSVALESSSGLSAHCDWLEVMYDFGVVGLVLYTLLNVVLVIKAWSLIRIKATYAAAFSAAFVLFFVISLTSHLIIYPSYFMFIVAFWGVIEGRGKESPCNV